MPETLRAGKIKSDSVLCDHEITLAEISNLIHSKIDQTNLGPLVGVLHGLGVHYEGDLLVMPDQVDIVPFMKSSAQLLS